MKSKKQKRPSVPTTPLEALCAQTETQPEEWSEVDGPDSGCGVDHWYRHADGTEAYVNADQGEYTVSVGGEE
ncbi:MAG: hypothetical protein ACOZE5_18315 [Verrucomicrobiota bacterium]